MGKRSNKGETPPRDYWPTIDPDAVKPSIPFIRGLKVAEVCAGNGDLAMMLKPDCKVLWESDLEPQNKYISKINATTLTNKEMYFYDAIVTNPPFSWHLLQPLLNHLPQLKPTWLLLPADVAHNKRMGPYMKKCNSVVSVGRLYWMENKVKGVDNYCWFEFTNQELNYSAFYGRT